MKTDILIIGGGPSAIACAIKLIDGSANLRITIIDSGKYFKERSCHIDEGNKCVDCHPTCNVMSGFGGCIHYGDCAKLTLFPTGKRLSEKIGYIEFKKLTGEALNMFFNSAGIGEFHTPECANMPFDVKEYPVYVASSKEINSFIENSYNYLYNSNNLNFMFEHTCNSIDILKDDFFISGVNHKNNTVFGITAQKVIIAVGRKGVHWCEELINKYKIEHIPTQPYIGFRFEMPSSKLETIGMIHPDLKVFYSDENFFFKTFCFCGGKNGGRIKYVNYGDYTLLDGHIFSEQDKTLGFGNFGVLMKITDEKSSIDVRQIKESILRKYINLNKERPGKPICQYYKDFRAKTTTTEKSKTSIMYSSVKDLYFADLFTLLSEEEHKVFCDLLDKIFDWLKSNNNPNNQEDEFTSEILVIALAIEGLWDEIMVDRNLLTNIPNLFFAGDCLGLSQGIIPSMISGAHIANSILKEK